MFVIFFSRYDQSFRLPVAFVIKHFCPSLAREAPTII